MVPEGPSGILERGGGRRRGEKGGGGEEGGRRRREEEEEDLEVGPGGLFPPRLDSCP